MVRQSHRVLLPAAVVAGGERNKGGGVVKHALRAEAHIAARTEGDIDRHHGVHVGIGHNAVGTGSVPTLGRGTDIFAIGWVDVLVCAYRCFRSTGGLTPFGLHVEVVVGVHRQSGDDIGRGGGMMEGASALCSSGGTDLDIVVGGVAVGNDGFNLRTADGVESGTRHRLHNDILYGGSAPHAQGKVAMGVTHNPQGAVDFHVVLLHLAAAQRGYGREARGVIESGDESHGDLPAAFEVEMEVGGMVNYEVRLDQHWTNAGPTLG